jgi:hypothetical protein
LDDSLSSLDYTYHCINEFPANLNQVAIFSKQAFDLVAISPRIRCIHVRFGPHDAVAYHASPRGIWAMLEPSAHDMEGAASKVVIEKFPPDEQLQIKSDCLRSGNLSILPFKTPPENRLCFRI